MVIRIIAALALVPLFFFIVYGGLPLYIAELIVGIIGLDEFYKAFKSKDVKPISILGFIFAIYLPIKNTFNLVEEYTYITIFILFFLVF